MGKQRGRRRASRRAVLRRLAGTDPIGPVKAKRKTSRFRTALRRGLLVGGILAVLAVVAAGTPRIARASGITPFQNFDVPEIDPGSLSGALTLLIGGCLTLHGRGRRD